MANIKSIGGNPIVVGMDGLTDEAKATLLANRPSATLSGSLVTADDAAPTTPIDTAIYGQSTQDGTPTPSSPVPIVSVEGDSEGNISLVACGRNLLDPSAAHSGTLKGITIGAPDADGWFTISGTSTATSAGLFALWGAAGAKILPAGNYTLLVETDGTPFVSGKVRLQVAGDGDSAAYVEGSGAVQLARTSPIDRISIHVSSSSEGSTVSGRFRLTLVPGTTAPAAYIPYVGSTTPIDLQGHELRSLPDGTRDELTVDERGHAVLVQRVGSVTLDGSETWAFSASVGQNYSSTVLPDSAILTVDQSVSKLMVNRFVPSSSRGAGTMYQINNIAVFWVGGAYNPTTAAEAKSWAAANNITVLHQLATPVTHDLGTVALVPLVGPDLTAQTVPVAPLALTYERDATITLDRLTAMWGNVAPVEGDTASANYGVGSYLMHGGQLCRVTTAIATGETITIGTNVTATTVMAEVVSLTQ